MSHLPSGDDVWVKLSCNFCDCHGSSSRKSYYIGRICDRNGRSFEPCQSNSSKKGHTLTMTLSPSCLSLQGTRGTLCWRCSAQGWITGCACSWASSRTSIMVPSGTRPASRSWCMIRANHRWSMSSASQYSREHTRSVDWGKKWWAKDGGARRGFTGTLFASVRSTQHLVSDDCAFAIVDQILSILTSYQNWRWILHFVQ